MTVKYASFDSTGQYQVAFHSSVGKTPNYTGKRTENRKPKRFFYESLGFTELLPGK